MKGIPILLEEIQDHFSEISYRRGESYFTQGRVQNLYYDTSNNHWLGVVNGTAKYHVEVEILEDFFDYYCECPAHRKYGECKHVVACMLEIVRKQDNRQSLPKKTIEKYQSKQMVNQFINAFSNFYQSEGYHQEHIKKHTLQVEFIVKTIHNPADLWTVELKVGVQRTYVVKKIKDLLQAIVQQNNYYFTDNYTYDPLEQIFHRTDYELIQLLIEISNNEEAFHSYSYQRKDERVVVIPPMVVDKFLDLLKMTNYTFESGLKTYKKINVYENELPFSFRLEKGLEDAFQLEIEELVDMDLFESYRYVLKEDCLYKITTEQKNILSEIASVGGRILLHNHSIDISADQIESFLSVVIPEMKKIGKIKIDEEVSNQIIQYPLQTKLMIDRDQETLLVDLEYNYGEVVVHPFNENATKTKDQQELMIRDIRKEQEIMSVLENAQLRFNGKYLYVEGEEEIYHFLHQTLPFLENKADIFLTSGVKQLLLADYQVPETSFDFNREGSLLEVTFDMKDIGQEQVQAILAAVIEKKKYYRLPDGAFVSIDGNEQFQQMQQLYNDLNIRKSDIEDGTLQLPIYRAMQVEDIINEGDRNKVRIGKQFRQLIQTLKNPDELEFVIPENLQAELRDYQEVGFQWLKTLAYYSLGGILADDMGLGKTVQAIAFLLSEKNELSEKLPSLIVAPASLIYNWKLEFEKFAPDLSAEVVIGSPVERKKMLENHKQPDVYITSYPTLRQDIDWYKEQKFHAFFLDEAQAIKNATTKTAKAVRMLRADKRFALSGTPIENSLDELWSIFQAVLPGFFPSQSAYRNLGEEKISRMGRPFILRRLKKDVLTELPDKIETTHVSELTKEQKELYLGYLERIQAETRESLAGEGLNKSRIKILAGLTRLRQLCCHPSLFIENYNGSSGKLEQLLEIVKNARENNKRMLIFSQFTSMLGIIREELSRQNLSYFYIDGQTPSKARVEMVENFNQGENDVFLISLKAGGTGLNLTGADTVILYDLWWNPAVEDQAAGRAHRMGQKNVVQVIRLLTKGTIEEKIEKLQQRKKELIEKVIQPGESMLSSITEEEIRELLSI